MEYYVIERTLREAAQKSLHMLEQGKLSPQAFRKVTNDLKKIAYFCGVTEEDFLEQYPENICGRCAAESDSLTDFYELADPDMYLLLYDRAEHPLLARNAVWHTRLCPRCMEEQLLGGRTVSGQIERLKDCRSAYEAQVAQGAPDNGLKAFMDELENRTDAAEDIEEKETSSEEQELGLRFLTEQALKMTGSVSRTAELLDRKEDYIEMLAEQRTAEENRR